LAAISVQRFGAIVTTPWIAPSLRADMIFREGQGLQIRRLTLDAELNDFSAQLAMLGGHAADRDG
jgi:hypothetical protein